MGYKLKRCVTLEMLDNSKFDVQFWSPEHKTVFQQQMFSIGYLWGSTEDIVQRLDAYSYYLGGKKYLDSYDKVSHHDWFYKSFNRELYWDDIFEESSDTDLVEECLDKVGLSSDLHIHHSVSPQNVTTGEVKDSLGSYISPDPEPFKLNFQTDAVTEWTDKHYDNYYTLTEEDIEEGKIRIDAYFVNRMWKLNSIDDTGCAFHCLKTYTRMANGKNSMERELNALNGQLKRWAKLMNVKLK